MGFTVEGRPAGGGLLDVTAVLQALAPFPRCATAALELWVPPEANLAATLAKEAAWATQSLAHLRPHFATTG